MRERRFRHRLGAFRPSPQPVFHPRRDLQCLNNATIHPAFSGGRFGAEERGGREGVVALIRIIPKLNVANECEMSRAHTFYKWKGVASRCFFLGPSPSSSPPKSLSCLARGPNPHSLFLFMPFPLIRKALFFKKKQPNEKHPCVSPLFFGHNNSFSEFERFEFLMAFFMRNLTRIFCELSTPRLSYFPHFAIPIMSPYPTPDDQFHGPLTGPKSGALGPPSRGQDSCHAPGDSSPPSSVPPPPKARIWF